MSTCNGLDWESLGSWPIMPKNFLGIDLEWTGSFHKATRIINSSRTQTRAFQFAEFSLFLRSRIFSSLDFTLLHVWLGQDFAKYWTNTLLTSPTHLEYSEAIFWLEQVKLGTVCMLSKFWTLFEDVKILNMMNMCIGRLWICRRHVVVVSKY